MGTKCSTQKTSPVSSFETIDEDWPWVWAIRDPECLDWKKGLSETEIRSEALRQNQMMPVPILDNVVFLGNAHSVESIARLKELGITAVLNMAGPLALKRKTIQAFEKNGIQYKGINAMDEPEYPLLQNHWKEASDFIQKSTATVEKDGGGKCVVHCVAGINRSGLIVAAHYMLTTQTPVLETVKHLRKQRGNVALFNEGFQQQLVSMARQHSLLGAKPGTEGSIVEQAPPAFENYWINL
eukprot:scaffold1049_cov108-Cylindrotheca_fusiformis.AAC.2